MNKNHLILCAACLVVSSTATAQFRIVYDSGMERNYTIQEAAISALAVSCRMYPDIRSADITEESTGKVTRIDCATAQKISRGYAAPKRDEKAETAAQKYKVFSKSKTGAWKAERRGYPTVGKAEAQVKRLCVHGTGTVVTAKIVDDSGYEKIIDCSTQ